MLLTRTPRRIPEPGLVELAFLAALAAHGIPSGSYNLPDWEENAVSFHARLDALFRVTPPTALILDEVPFFMAAMHFCASRGIRVTDDVSLVCTDPDPTFDWFVPSVAHIRWEATPLVRRALRWADNISRGKDDRRQTETRAEFIAGGTLGRAKRDLNGSDPPESGGVRFPCPAFRSARRVFHQGREVGLGDARIEETGGVGFRPIACGKVKFREGLRRGFVRLRLRLHVSKP